MPTQDTVLIVEDERGIRELLADTLHRAGYYVITAASVEEAEDIRQRQGLGGIGLVIADINLTAPVPQPEGYTLAQRWRMLEPRLPFLLLSGDPSNQDLLDIRAGTMRFLVSRFLRSSPVRPQFLVRPQLLTRISSDAVCRGTRFAAPSQ